MAPVHLALCRLISTHGELWKYLALNIVAFPIVLSHRCFEIAAAAELWKRLLLASGI